MKIDLKFIPQNIAPKGAKNIGLYDFNGNKLKNIPLGKLAPKSKGNKLYTFGALSDVHLPYTTGTDDFIRALNYLNNEEVDFICISGDMGSVGTDDEWASYKNHVDTYSPNTTVHISAGNHDVGQSERKSYDYPIPYTGNPLYYSFTQGDDVFIIFGMSLWGNPPFSNESLQWLYETLEENRNKRCFVFEHFMRYAGCGNANGTYYADNLNNTNGKVFLSLMEHYKNVLWFHGHSHTKFNVQEVMPSPIANYDRMFGCHSIHVPSLCYPRDKDMNSFHSESEGYVVDVYGNGIHLRGRDFVAEKFLPIASYWIDTKLAEIKANTYSDPYSIIDTGNNTPSIPSDNIVVFDKSELMLNERYSYSGGEIVETGGVISINPSIEPNTTYKLTYRGAKTDITSNYDTLYLVSSEGAIGTTNGSRNISQMSQGVVFVADYTGVDVIFTTNVDTASIWFNVLFKPAGTYIKDADELTDVVLTLEKSANYTNLLPLSTDINGNDFVGVNGEDGYISGYRIKSDGTMVEQVGGCATGFMPCGNINFPIRIKNFTLYEPTGMNSTVNRIAYYDTNKEFVKDEPLLLVSNGVSEESDGVMVVIPYHYTTDATYFRISTGIINENTIITVNEII